VAIPVWAGIPLVAVAAAYVLGYYFYGKRVLEARIVRASPSRRTPAYTRFDGIDYVPANKYVLFGHHFASIAGAGPIVGPAIAMVYGWGLPLLWVIFGNVFIGAVHDYLSLMASVRHGGLSIMSVSENVMGRKAKYVFLLYVYSALLLVLAAFLSINAILFAKTPSAATKAMLYMPIAIMVGYLLYRTRLSPKASSLIGLAVLVGAVAYAIKVPFYIPGFAGIDVYHTWLLLLAGYAFLASVLPVWYLLQPRDYLNAFLLWSFVGIAFVGAIGAALRGLSLTAPLYTTWAPKIAAFAGQPTPFWPAIALIIACGSLSGFHSIVASGTTSKQLANEMDALLIGYGGMLTEGAVSSMAVIIPMGIAWSQPDMATLLKAVGLGGKVAAYQAKGILALGPLGGFEAGYGYMLGKALGSLGTVGAVMFNFAAIALATFILTTLDTATRLTRFAWQEMFDWLQPRSPGLYRAIANMFTGSAIAVAIGLAMAYPYVEIKGKLQPAYKVIWPAFAGTNQLLAALALLTAALWVYAVLRVRETKYSLLIQVPAWFLWITVTVGLAWWTVDVLPHLPHIQQIGAGTLVLISLGVDLLLIALYVMGLSRARAEKAAAVSR